MKKLLLVLILGSLVTLLPQKLYADKPDNTPTLPETNGTYDVPGRPNLKLRVIVHPAKGSKPGGSTPSLSCGLSDPDSVSVVSPAGWHLPSSFTYRLNNASVPSSVGAGSTAIAAQSFGTWSGAVNNKITFTQGSDTFINKAALDGQNVITWGRTQGTALAVTYIWYDKTTGIASELDTIMNLKFFWKWSDSSTCAWTNAYDAQDILTHELGHWMGLDDEYAGEFTNNTMFGYGSQMEAKKDTLTTGDISAVSSLY